MAIVEQLDLLDDGAPVPPVEVMGADVRTDEAEILMYSYDAGMARARCCTSSAVSNSSARARAWALGTPASTSHARAMRASVACG